MTLTWTKNGDGTLLSDTFGPEGFSVQPWRYQIVRLGRDYRIALRTFRGDVWVVRPMTPRFRTLRDAIAWCGRDKKSRVATGEVTTRLEGATE